MPRTIHSVLLRSVIVLMLGLSPAIAIAQQSAPSCEDVLAQAQAQLAIMQATRTQGEYVAADALAASRKTVAQLQARIADLEKQLSERRPQ